MIVDVNRLIDEINDLSKSVIEIKNAIIKSLGYDPFEESVNTKVNEMSKYLETTIFHMLKFYFSTNDTPKNQWRITIERSMKNFSKGVIINDKINTNIINKLEISFQDIYQNAYDDYMNESEMYTDLLYNIDNIPIKCPWTLEDFLYKDIDELLEILGG